MADLTHDEARRAAAVALEAQIREDIAASAVSRAGETPDEGRARVKAELGALCERLARAQAAAEGREGVECSSDVTIDDLDRYRATESRAAVATLTDDERAKMAAHYAANPRALDKCRAWVAANPKPTETL